ncbi:MAG: SMC-Scp complex subunit ScpB [Parasporobacterium sp.]|nr:SMC-Scp complex subunit ScpB [Parasporobacterium sp.]
MEKDRIKSIVESILFTMGEAVEAERIAAALEMSKKDLVPVIEEMITEYEELQRGVRIIEIDGSYQMCTTGDSYEYLIRLVKIPRNYKLTDIQLETLSIIAYKQPVTKLEIEKIRGVQSDYAVNRLVEVGLVEEVGRLEQPGRPVLFGTTEEFLRRFGLKNTEELPDINVEKAEAFKLEAEQELGYIQEPGTQKNPEPNPEQTGKPDPAGEQEQS